MCAAAREPVAHHAGLRERERREDADHVEVDEAVRVRAVDPEEQAGDRREHDHPVREDEPVAEVRELARREAVAREQRREAWEALERGVRGEDQHEQRQALNRVVHEASGRSGGEHGARDLRDDRCRRARPRVQVHREIRDAEEEEDRDRAEDRERGRRVLAVRAAERVHPVCDRLHTGQRGRAGRERAEEHEQRDRAGSHGQRMRHDRTVSVARRELDRARDDEHAHRGDEEIRRQREEQARLADTAQVDEHDQEETSERERDLVSGERRGDRRHGEDPRRDRDGHGQHVVGEERRRPDEARQRPEVLARDDVGAAARLVGPHRLHVRDDDDGEERGDRNRDREDEMRRRRGNGEQHDERRLRRVCDRREWVGREDRQRERLGKERLLQLPGPHGPADEELPHAPAGCGDLGHGSSAPSTRPSSFGSNRPSE